MSTRMATRRREQGLALVLVMTVVLALAVVATPFVLSMLLQERSGTAQRYDSQAEYGAEGAKNYAIWRLGASVEALERKSGSGVFSSYFHDTRRELDVRIDETYLEGPQAEVMNPRGKIWGLTVQDEQGKLNLQTAPTSVLATLAQVVDGRPGTYVDYLSKGVADLKDYTTIYSGRDASWIAPQRIRPVGHETGQGAGGTTVDNLQLIGRDARVRLSKPGARPVIARVTGNAVTGGQPGFTTDPPATGHLWGVIEVEQRHPVNINTARRETLVALFEGVRLFGVPQSVVTRDAAVELATRLHGKEFDRMEQFIRALASTGLSGPQKVAVALNAVCPTMAVLDGSGTLPVGFKSYDVHSIEGYASVNTPAGTEAAGRGFREIVSVAPPALLQLACESQHDFGQMLNPIQAALQGIAPQFAFTGYPYGGKMHTYPNPPGQEADTALKNRQSGDRDAYVTLVPAEDYRGQSIHFQGQTWADELTGWADARYARDHYSDQRDGKKLSGPETAAWTKYFCLNHRTQGGGGGGGANQRPDTGAGGVEFWAKFEASPSGMTLFEIKESDTMNQVSLRVEGTDLVLRASDGTMGTAANLLDNGWAEVRQPFHPPLNTWVHIGAYWKSTRACQLALLVDGFAHPDQKFQHKSPEDTPLLTRLSGALGISSTTLSLANSAHLSGPTPLLVGAEVVMYDPTASPNVLRGARGTTAVDHPAQVPVSVWGYTSELRNSNVRVQINANTSTTVNCPRLPVTSARVLYNFGLNPQAQVAGDKQDPTTMQWQIDAMQTDIGVTTANIMDFPDQGYIRIRGEVIFYQGRSNGGLGGPMGGNAKFTQCQRGQHGTVPSVHPTGAAVSMWCVPVDNRNGFEQTAILQIGDEWFGPVRQDPLRPTFWIPFMDAATQRPLRLLRGPEVMGSLQGAKSTGDPVLPTFITESMDRWPANIQPMGRGDVITLTDGANQREQAQVRNTNPHFPPGQRSWQPGPMQYPVYSFSGDEQLVALYQPVQRDYVADQLHVRALKFPSGELLSRTWLDAANPQVTVGGWQGYIDEQKAFAIGKQPYGLAQQADASATMLRMQSQPGFFEQGGLIKIGDEYIGYGRAQAGTLSTVVRGWLNSKGEAHDAGDLVFYLPWIPVSGLQSDVAPNDRVLYLNQSLNGDLQKYTRGYVLLDEELVLVEWSDPRGGSPWDARTMTMPATFDGTTGLYRGMFGTQVSSHSSSTSLAYGLPWRYWDTYKAREFDNTMAYFQWSTKQDLAGWKNLRWMQELPQGEDKLVVHAFARLDGLGEFWDTPAMTDLVALAESVTPGGPIALNRIGCRKDAGQLDVRFVVEYKQGSFDARNPSQAHAWKKAAKIREVRVDFDKPVRTLFREDR